MNRFIEFKLEQLQSSPEHPMLQRIQEAANSDQYLYDLIQPTGLLYGHPIRFIGTPHRRYKRWSEKSRTKVLLAESYVGVSLYYQYPQIEFLPQALQLGLTDIRDFYQQNYVRYRRPPRGFFSRQGTTLEQLETIIEHRLNIQYNWRKFWASFFNNSLLFFDLIFFSEWKARENLLPSESLAQRRQHLRFVILSIIAAAAYSDKQVDREERELFNFFLQSAHLPAPLKRKAENYLRKGVSLEELELTEIRSWVLKKYYLELALLTLLSKKEIKPEEADFLLQLCQKLGLPATELEKSTQSVQSFVEEHAEQVHFLQLKQNYRIVSARMVDQLGKIVKKNQKRIIKEIRESKELVYLLQKSTRQPLSTEEKEKVRTQLLDILKAIPAFAIFMLPGGSFTLPILFKILPKNILFPSSFQEDPEDD